ncbi:MAG: cold shock domain-containing protein [bacterium]
MLTGKVKTVTGRGFGFIKSAELEKDIFYHEATLVGELATRKLRVDDEVTFETEQSEKGPRAINISLVQAE